MITSKNLTFSYDEGKKILVDLNLTIPTSKFSLLIGPTGCGKSTLLKVLAGLYPKYAGQLSGQLNLNGLTGAMMFQNAGEQFTMATPREEIIFALENLQVNAAHYPKRLQEAVQFTQIESLLDQKINTMSGGEQQRVALAVLVAMDIDLFLLDEPFASCDPEARKFLIAKLAHLRDQGKTIILSDHVLTGYASVCDCLFRFNDKTVALLNAADMHQLLVQSDHHNDTYTFALPQPGESACFTLKKTKIAQNRLLLDQDRLDIVSGKVTLITGANGVGKTSLFGALTKMIPYSGSLGYLDKEIKKQVARTYLRRVGQIFQTASDQFINITVKDEIALSKKQQTSSFFTGQKITEALSYLELDQLLDQVVYTLSGGQQKKLQILLMLIADSNVLLIDEPLSGLDPKSVRKVMKLLRESQKQRGQTLLIISHELAGLADWCDYHLVFSDQHLTYVNK
ncbi:ATP-binding cassette domain-containing protein [Lactobacillus xylocopicola]|uniref:ABC transporter ATP-binding protein n=1 Tax=Lactobacillus xylocopicola TaxID=2976676 RepID=A0ABM8BF31_9LACO|nr:ABC transporter ATP-binding protein [Lactobacillus xylocopicola]BDR59843.1 ABC transporter ATP-binding protein [Lactobacillus xylocopicola]